MAQRADATKGPKVAAALGGTSTRWPLKIEDAECLPICLGYAWSITDEKLLATYIAHLAMGQALAVARVLEALETALPNPPATTAIDAAIANLGPPVNVQRRWRRDGWVFQTIAWLAAWRRKSKNDLIRTPQARQAEHGLDGLLIRLDDADTTVHGVTICEQKATENARKQIHDKVWPELEDYESGKRDDQLVAEVTALLAGNDPESATRLASAIHWNDKRWYRVAVTVEERLDGATMSALFAGFDEKVAGSPGRRHGEVLPVGNLRDWMDAFCISIVSELRKLRPT